MQANHTYLSRVNLSNRALLMVDTPRHKSYGAVTYQAHARVSLLADIRYEGGRFFQNDGGRFGRASNFAAVGLGGMVKLYRQVELQAGVNNAADRLYFLVDGYPEAGRNAYVNLRYRF